MKKVIVFSGKKQSGKNLCASFLPYLFPDLKVQEFAFADPLKRFLIDVMGLEERHVYGTDFDKNEDTHLRWEDFSQPVWFYSDGCYSFDFDRRLQPVRATGPLSGRNAMQFWGTEVFRNVYPKIWVDAWGRNVDRSDCDIAVGTDCRFPDEVHGGRERGVVIRLTRAVFNDNHRSETALDPGNFDHRHFDYVVNNTKETPVHITLWAMANLLIIGDVLECSSAFIDEQVEKFCIDHNIRT